jgi:proteasome accessory factor A
MGSETEYSIFAPEGDYLKLAWQLTMNKTHLPTGLIKATNPESSNGFFSNGAREYIDIGCHPEYCTPPAFGALGATICERAGVELYRHKMGSIRTIESIKQTADVTDDMHLLRRITNDHESWGYHINLQTERSLEVSKERLSPLLIHMIGSLGLFGAGHQRKSGDFWISQRAHDIKDYINNFTMSSRPLINNRDEPLADPARWRRLHIIGNDVLHSPWATWLRFTTFDLAVALAEARPDIANKLSDKLPKRLNQAMHTFARSLDGRATVELKNSQRVTTAAYEEMIFSEVEMAVNRGDIAAENDAFERQIGLQEWSWAIEQLQQDPDELGKLCDWRLRLLLNEKITERENLTTPAQQHGADVMLDDMEYRGKTGEYARIFQSTLETNGWQRLADIFNLDAPVLKNQVTYYMSNPYPGRSWPLAEAVRRLHQGADGDVSWQNWRVDDEFYFAPDPLVYTCTPVRYEEDIPA